MHSIQLGLEVTRNIRHRTLIVPLAPTLATRPVLNPLLIAHLLIGYCLLSALRATAFDTRLVATKAMISQ